jgi:hypothetical protein
VTAWSTWHVDRRSSPGETLGNSTLLPHSEGSGHAQLPAADRPTDPPGWKRSLLPSLGLAHHAVFQLRELHFAHMKVTTSPRGIRELYCRLVSYGDQAVVGPPGHDRGALGATRVGLNDEMPALLGVLDIALGSSPALSPLFCGSTLCLPLRPPLADCLPTTASEPSEGTNVDSSPVDHRNPQERLGDAGHDSVAGSLAHLRRRDLHAITNDCHSEWWHAERYLTSAVHPVAPRKLMASRALATGLGPSSAISCQLVPAQVLGGSLAGKLSRPSSSSRARSDASSGGR